MRRRWGIEKEQREKRLSCNTTCGATLRKRKQRSASLFLQHVIRINDIHKSVCIRLKSRQRYIGTQEESVMHQVYKPDDAILKRSL